MRSADHTRRNGDLSF